MERKRVMKIGLVVLLALSLVALLFGACAPKAEVVPEEGKAVVIGCITDMTGPASGTTLPMFQGSSDYFKWLNREKGGIEYLDPKTGTTERVKVKFRWGDNKGSVAACASTYERMYAEGMLFLEMFATVAAVGTEKQLKRDHIPAISMGAGADTLDPTGWIYATSPTQSQSLGLFMEWIAKNWKGAEPPKLAVLTWDNAWGRAVLTDEVAAFAEKVGVNLVSRDIMPFFPVDMTTQLVNIRDKDADYLWLVPIAAPSAVVLKDIKRLGMEIQTAGAPSGSTDDIITMGGEASEGHIMCLFTAWPEDEHIPLVKVAKVEAVKNRPDEPYILSHLWGIVGAVVSKEAVKRALEENGYPVTSDDVKSALTNMKNYECEGLILPDTWEPGDTLRAHLGMKSMGFCQVKGGKKVDIAEPMPLPYETLPGEGL